MSNAVISVIMPVCNGARFLDRAVASVRAQTFPDWELIAVDDSSTDDSAERLEVFAAADSRIRVFRHPSNRGIAAARNTAMAQARGHLITYIDQDDEFYPDHLARAVSWPDKSDVLVFRYDQLDERDRSPTRGRLTEYNPETRYQYMFTETITKPLGVVHRRDLLNRVGTFNETLRKHRGQEEDADLWRRFARAGAKFIFVPYKSGRHYIRTESHVSECSEAPRLAAGFPSPIVPIEVRADRERFTIHIPQNDSFIVTQIFERHEYGGVPLGILQSPPVILDVGANVGSFAIYAKLCYRRDAVIHCFEPYPPTIELFRRNIVPFPDVNFYPIGLGQSDAVGDMLLNPRLAAANTVRPELLSQPAGRAQVQLRDAGRMWDELKLTEVDVLKVDTEGCEVEILESLGERLTRCRAVLAEFHTRADRRRIDALLSGHELFGTVLHRMDLGIVKYIRADLLGS